MGAISKHGIIGSYWFEDENERAQTVNTERCVAVLRKFWTSLGRRREFDRDDQWFQQDGQPHFPTHTSNHTLDWLREQSQERLISRKCDIEWAPHSPDLNPQDFYLLGYLKDNVYQKNPQTIGELKAAIAAKNQGNPQRGVVRVIDSFAQWMRVCLQRQGGHLKRT